VSPLTAPREHSGSPATALPPPPIDSNVEGESYTAPPPHSPASEASSIAFSPHPPPFSSLYTVPEAERGGLKFTGTETDVSPHPSFAPTSPGEESPDSWPASSVVADTKAAFERDKKGEAVGKAPDDGEPPPPYTEGSSPIQSFTYVMAAAGGAASIITQVQQSGGPPINVLGGMPNLVPQSRYLLPRPTLAGFGRWILILALWGNVDIGGDEQITLDLR
jgi:dipeptidyl-peptidase III